MHQRPIVGASETGSISRLQARTAARAVKMAKSTGATARKRTSKLKKGQLASASAVERYLGHFGAGRSNAARKTSAVKNRPTTKSKAKADQKEGDA